MAQSADDLIAVCAGIAEGVRSEISATLISSEARKSHYDRQTKLRLEYGIRTCERIVARIRGLIGEDAAPPPDVADGAKLTAALALLSQLRPVVATGRDSAWKAQTLQQIDALTSVISPRPKSES